MDVASKHISDERIASIVRDIDEKGIACLPNYVSSADLCTMQAFVRSALAKNGGQYASFKGPETVQGSGLERLAYSPDFRSVMSRIYEVGTGKKAPDTDYYQLLRCLSGQHAEAHSMRFHYDTYVLTALIPVQIPEHGQRGNLLVIPNTRKVRKTYYGNLIDKMLVDNRVSQALLKRLAKSPRSWIVSTALTPGHLYFFWGYRSIHTNEPCDPNDIRATALYHFVDPHSHSGFKRRLGRS